MVPGRSNDYGYLSIPGTGTEQIPWTSDVAGGRGINPSWALLRCQGAAQCGFHHHGIHAQRCRDPCAIQGGLL